MELFKPDVIVLDETFTAWGYDHHREHGCPLLHGVHRQRIRRGVLRGSGCA
jgi:hypothetical protein